MKITSAVDQLNVERRPGGKRDGSEPQRHTVISSFASRSITWGDPVPRISAGVYVIRDGEKEKRKKERTFSYLPSSFFREPFGDPPDCEWMSCSAKELRKSLLKRWTLSCHQRRKTCCQYLISEAEEVKSHHNEWIQSRGRTEEIESEKSSEKEKRREEIDWNEDTACCSTLPTAIIRTLYLSLSLSPSLPFSFYWHNFTSCEISYVGMRNPVWKQTSEKKKGENRKRCDGSCDLREISPRKQQKIISISSACKLASIAGSPIHSKTVASRACLYICKRIPIFLYTAGYRDKRIERKREIEEETTKSEANRNDWRRTEKGDGSNGSTDMTNDNGSNNRNQQDRIWYQSVSISLLYYFSDDRDAVVVVSICYLSWRSPYRLRGNKYWGHRYRYGGWQRNNYWSR